MRHSELAVVSISHHLQALSTKDAPSLRTYQCDPCPKLLLLCTYCTHRFRWVLQASRATLLQILEYVLHVPCSISHQEARTSKVLSHALWSPAKSCRKSRCTSSFGSIVPVSAETFRLNARGAQPDYETATSAHRDALANSRLVFNRICPLSLFFAIKLCNRKHSDGLF
jgi:hypothetical protein